MVRESKAIILHVCAYIMMVYLPKTHRHIQYINIHNIFTQIFTTSVYIQYTQSNTFVFVSVCVNGTVLGKCEISELSALGILSVGRAKQIAGWAGEHQQCSSSGCRLDHWANTQISAHWEAKCWTLDRLHFFIWMKVSQCVVSFSVYEPDSCDCEIKLLLIKLEHYF